MSKFPDQLIRIAATGSSPRAKATITQTQFPLLDHWQPQSDSPERDLLLSIAAYGLQYQAAYVPKYTLDRLPPRVDPSIFRACTLTAQQHLKLMLNRIHEELLPYWINAIHDHQQRIPDEMLPMVLDYGSNHQRHHALLRRAIGQRGRWLAEQANNTSWHWILQEEAPEDPHESHYAAWENYFKRLRQRDPVRALAIVEAYWDDLDALMRMALLRTMKFGLNPNDTDFLLKRCADETTIFTAAQCLLNIKESAFAIEARKKISRLLVLAEINGEWVVDFTWTSTFDGHPLGIDRAEADQLCTIMDYEFNPELMLMLLPLSYWYETYNIGADVLVTAASNSSRPSVFHRIWTNMAIQEPDSDFLFALVMNVERHASMSLVDYLTQDQLKQAAAHWLHQKPFFSLQHNATALLNAINETWSEDLAHIFLDSLEACFSQMKRPLLDNDIRQILKHYARLLPLSVDERFETVLHLTERDELSDSEIEQLNGIINIIRFRADMITAIQDGTT